MGADFQEELLRECAIFAREAKKYMVDIDPANLKTKWQQLKFDENILCDAKKFIKILTKEFLKQINQSLIQIKNG